MGEANPEAMTLIQEHIGHWPEYGEHPDGSQFLRIGDIVINAEGFGLWSDPSVYVYGHDALHISWGGNGARLWRDSTGRWAADIKRDPLRGTARWVR